MGGGVVHKAFHKRREPPGKAFTLQRLFQRALGGECRQRLGDGEGMTVGDQRLFQEIVVLQHRFIDALHLVVAAVGEDLFYQRQRRRHIFLQHTGGNQQIRLAMLQIAGGGGQLQLGNQRAHGGFDLVLQLVGGIVLGTQLAEAGGQHLRHAQLVGGKIRHIKVQIQIHNAVGGGDHLQHLSIGNGGQHGFGGRHLHRHILQIQMRQGAKHLVAVHALLPLLHLHKIVERLLPPGIVPCGGGSCQFFRLFAGIVLPFGERRQHIQIGFVGRIRQQLGEQIGKIRGADLFAQRRKYAAVINMGHRVVPVQPAVERFHRQLHAVRLADLLAVERKAFQRSQQRLVVQPLRQQCAHRFGQKRFDLVKPGCLGVAHDQRQAGLIHQLARFKRHILRQPLLQKRAFQRCFVGTGQIIRQNFGGVNLFGFLVGPQNFRDRHMRQLFLALARFVVHRFFGGDRRLHHKIEIRRAIFVFRQVFAVNIRQHRVNIHVPV